MKLISKEDRLSPENQLKRTKIVFTVCTIAFFVIAITNMVTATYEYFGNLIFNVLLTIIYGWYAVYYFSALLPYRKAKYRFFVDWDNGMENNELVEIVDQSLTKITKNKLCYYQANAVITINGKRMQRQLLLADRNPLPIGKMYVKSFNNVVLEYNLYHEK